jgi:hypothetical protein
MADKKGSSGPYGVASLDKVTADVNTAFGAGSLMTLGNGALSRYTAPSRAGRRAWP